MELTRSLVLSCLSSVCLAVAGDAVAQVELTRGAIWEYRVNGGLAESWTTNLQHVLDSLGPTNRPVQWPKSWRTYTPWEYETGNPPRSDDPTSFTNVPAAMTLNGVSACRASLGLYGRGFLDLTLGQGAPQTGRWAYAFGTLQSAKDQEANIHIGACAPLKLWLDGKLVLDATNAGKYSFLSRLTKGEHICAARIESGADQWSLTGEAVSSGPARPFQARCVFESTTNAGFVSLTYAGPHAEAVLLNGQPLPLQLPGTDCTEVNGVPPALLKPGRNVIELASTASEALHGTPAGRLLGVRAEDASVLWGPVVTRATDTSVTLVCRLNALAPATARMDGRESAAKAATIHTWQFAGLKPATAYRYTVTVGSLPPSTGDVRTFPSGGKVTIGVAGDPQSGLPWAGVARSMENGELDAVVIAGDLVNDGLSEELWGRTFFAPAASLLASVPCLVVPGNHDRRSPVFDRFFGNSAVNPNWKQDVGDVLLLGLDGNLDWSPASPSARWLGATLATATNKFIFAVTHYPPYSSRNHGKLADDDRLLERTSRVARTQIVPVLERFGVTAVFSGHDHGYERSELPSGLTAVVTAGAGAGSYEKRDDASHQNPYSKVLVTTNHYTRLQVDGDTAVMTVVTPDGQTIDKRSWTASTGRRGNR